VARIFRGSPTVKTGAPSTQVTFGPSELPAIGGLSVVGVCLGFEEAADLMSVVDLTRVRVKGNQRTFVDTTGNFIANMLNNLGEGKYNGNVDVTTRQFLYVPLNIFDADSDDEADVCGMPPGELPTIELTIGASSGAAPIFAVGLVLSNIPTQYRPSIRSFPGGASASQTGFPVRFADSGLLRAFGIENGAADNTQLAGLRLYANGQLKFATGFGNTTVNSQASGQVMRALQAGLNGGLPVTLTPTWVKLAGMLPVTDSSSSYFEVDTPSGWTSAMEFGLWSLIPVGAGG
jgi:hypothetical protein